MLQKRGKNKNAPVRFLTILLALIFILSLAVVAGNSNNDNSQDTGNPTTGQVPEGCVKIEGFEEEDICSNSNGRDFSGLEVVSPDDVWSLDDYSDDSFTIKKGDDEITVSNFVYKNGNYCELIGFDWSSTIPIGNVWIKGGAIDDTHEAFDPPVYDGSIMHGEGEHAISNIVFCTTEELDYNLEVTKEVTGDGPESGYEYTVYQHVDNEGENEWVTILEDIDIEKGETKYHELPDGYYKIIETEDQGADSVKYNNSVEYNNTDVEAYNFEIEDGATKKITITNTFEELDYNLKVTKEVIGGGPDSGYEYTVYGSVYTEGEWVKGEPLNSVSTINDGDTNKYTLDPGDYWIVETDDKGADSVKYNNSDVDAYNFEIKDGETTTITITNTFEEPEGILKVTKEVIGDGPDSDYEYTVYGSVYTEGEWVKGEPLNSVSTINDGDTNKYTLDPGDYWIVETDDKGADSVKYNNSDVDAYNFEIKDGETTMINITNTFDPTPPSNGRTPTPTPTPTPEKGTLEVTKIVTGEGAGDEERNTTYEYFVYSDDDGEIGDPVNSASTIGDGDTNDYTLDPDNYWIVETETYGADLVEYNNSEVSAYSFEINDETTTTVTITNIFEEIIVPVDPVPGAPIDDPIDVPEEPVPGAPVEEEELPVTGANNYLIIGMGLLLAAGGVLLLRKRIQTS